jgi:putative YphP/YqiW family bacilliredoxin
LYTHLHESTIIVKFVDLKLNTMPYPEYICAPMREELVSIGFEELRTAQDVDEKLPKASGTSLVVVNSVCGCAAGAARPGVNKSLSGAHKPDNLYTVFAGQDLESTAQVRKYMLPYPPSSPAIALFKDGQLVHVVERHQIEGHSADIISDHLQKVYEEFC